MKKTNPVSRRDFLKFSGMGLASILATPKIKSRNQLTNQQGRVIYDSIHTYDVPSFSGNITRQYWVDTIIPITEATIGDDEPDYNRVWYRIGEVGFAHSGGIQPVKTIPQEPIANGAHREPEARR